MIRDHTFLKVCKNEIKNQAGEAVTLRGIGLGGWMNMENFITGFPANEKAFRQVVYRALGKEKADFLFDRYLEYFFTTEDVKFIRSLGLNLVRLPFNYQHFEDDMNPMVIRESGWRSLDRVINICAENEIYTILDLHAAAGYQNQDWHSDNPSQRAFFWEHKHFQDRTVWLWEKIAERYKDGFINGGSYPGFTRGEYFNAEVLCNKLMQTCQYMLENGTPIWIGEFGPVYTGIRENDAMRYKVLEDQLSFYKNLRANWSLWTYKDLGLQGLVSLPPDSKWARKIQPILDKKAVLGVDAWGGLDKNVRHIMEPIEQTFAEFYPNYQPFPFGAQWQIHRTVRHILLAEPLIEDFYPLLQGLDFDEIDELMASFLYANCSPRAELIQIIKKDLQVN